MPSALERIRRRRIAGPRKRALIALAKRSMASVPGRIPCEIGWRRKRLPDTRLEPAQAAQDALAALRQAEADREARGLLARLRTALRGE